VPEGFSRPSYSHRQGQQTQQNEVFFIIPLSQALVSAHAGIMVYVPRLGHTHHRMQQQHPVYFPGGPLGQFLMNPVQGLAGLESEHIGVTEVFQTSANMGRSQAQFLEVVVAGQLEHLKLAGQVKLAPLTHF
jgi:hypothetical protein